MVITHYHGLAMPFNIRTSEKKLNIQHKTPTYNQQRAYENLVFEGLLIIERDARQTIRF